ncbi:MAG: hypothetical protein H6Q73_3714 [Firmicutes bacterium]|nr:hypothetical protein [Bacillota bacterium]
MAPAGDQNPRYMSAYDDFDAQGNTKKIDYGMDGYILLDVQAQELGSEVLRIATNMKEFASGAQIKGITKTISVPGKHGRTDSLNLRLGLLLIDNVAFVGFPGELVTSVGLALKDSFKSLNCEHTVVVTQCNGSNGYFSDDNGYKNQTFDGAASSAKPGYDKQVINAEKDMLKALTVN